MHQLAKINSMQYNFPATGINGRITSAVDAQSQTLSYSYDNLNRLVGVSGHGVGIRTGAWSEIYSYDGFCNLLAKTQTGTAPTLSINVDQYNHVTTRSYDLNGNDGGCTSCTEG